MFNLQRKKLIESVMIKKREMPLEAHLLISLINLLQNESSTSIIHQYLPILEQQISKYDIGTFSSDISNKDYLISKSIFVWLEKGINQFKEEDLKAKLLKLMFLVCKATLSVDLILSFLIHLENNQMDLDISKDLYKFCTFYVKPKIDDFLSKEFGKIFIIFFFFHILFIYFLFKIN